MNFAGTPEPPLYWDSPPDSGAVALFNDQQVVLPGPDDQVRVIVQLRDDPVAIYLTRTFGAPSSLTNAEAAGVRQYSDTLATERRQVLTQIQQQGIPFKVNREFVYLLNGLALSIKMGDWQRLTSLPQVKAVYPDYEMYTTLEDSVPLIGAPSVWAMTDSSGNSVTGQGVRVAIIDTGIDYTHPDLGGCLGPTCKVIGGYDFVNNDSDPMDDMGHGTHVAGIVAASGVLTGVAPGSKLLAYKVCDAYGSCWSSNIIAALERAADPDGNPATDDGAHVANLSLGGPGDPNDPTSQVVDNAVDLGMVVAVAAGNSGPGYETLGSPGVARKALTVAASDKSDQLASFSSRGPVQGFYDVIKPDITAPGVLINSTVPISGLLGSPSRYRFLSGTSMATPHIAGAAALVKQLHPTWSPEMIKANLMNTAKDLGKGIFEQGSGRVDVYSAATGSAIVSPSNLGLGIDDLTQSVWSSSKTFTVTNISNSTSNFSLSISGALPAGITTTLSDSNITLATSQSRAILFTLSVDNSIVPNSSTPTNAYEGKIIIQSGTSVSRVPFAFFKSPVLNITFDDEVWILYIHNRIDKWWLYPYPGSSRSILLPVGDYDVMVLYRDVSYEIVREHVVVSTITNLTVRKSEATNELYLRMLDKDSREIVLDGSSSPGSAMALIHNSSGLGLTFSTSGWGEPYFRLHFSDLSPAYHQETGIVARNVGPTKDQYGFLYSLDGISGNVTLQNDPSQFKSLEYQIQVDPSTQQLMVFETFLFGYGGGYGSGQMLYPPFKLQAYYEPAANLNGFFKFNYLEVLSNDPFSGGQLLYQTPYLYFRDRDNVDLYFLGSPYDLVLTTASKYFPIGQAPPHWFGKFENNSSEIRLKGARGVLNSIYLNQMQDIKPHDNLPYELYQAGTLIKSGVLSGVGRAMGSGPLPPPVSIPLPAPGAYTFTVPYTQYLVGTRTGNARVTVGFDTRNNDKNPPTLLTLNIFVGDRMVDTISPLTSGTIRFSVEDDVSLSQVALAYSVGETWQNLPLSQQNNVYTAGIPSLPNNSYVALKVTAQDAQGNWLSYEVNPAFQVSQETPTPTPTATPTATPTNTPTPTPTATPTATPTSTSYWLYLPMIWKGAPHFGGQFFTQ